MLVQQTILEFLDHLASKSPAPGGGSTAALAGALGAALTSMVCNLTMGKKKYADVESEMKQILQQSETLRQKFTALIDKDTHVFKNVMEAYALPKENDEQKTQRTAAIESATKEAALVPLEVMHHCIEGLTVAQTISEKGNALSISDAGVCTIMLYGALECAALNVKINLKGLSEREFVEKTAKEVQSLQSTGFSSLQKILGIVRAKIDSP